jgi:hypothetical protein
VPEVSACQHTRRDPSDPWLSYPGSWIHKCSRMHQKVCPGPRQQRESTLEMFASLAYMVPRLHALHCLSFFLPWTMLLSLRHLALIQLCPTSFCTDPYACSLTLPLTSSSCADQNLYETCPRACDMLTVSLQSADKSVSNSSAMLPPWYHTLTIPAPTIRWTTFLPFLSSCFYLPT